MTRLYLVRHGRAAAGFDEALDPGLDEVGQSQASEAADQLAGFEPMLIISSPMKRCQETAFPLATRWNKRPLIDEGVSEIPSPTQDTTERAVWLRKIMSGSWSDGEAGVQEWRANVIGTLKDIREDAVIFSHFIAINAVVGHILGNDRVVCFKPDNASITILENEDGHFRVVSLGSEASTKVG